MVEFSLTPKRVLGLADGRRASNHGPFSWWGPASAAIWSAGAPHNVVTVAGGRYFAWWRGRQIACYNSATGELRIDWPAIAGRARELVREAA